MSLSEPSKSHVSVATEAIAAAHATRGLHVVLEGFPCRVVGLALSKTGKHGHRKAVVTGIDLVSGKKYSFGGPGDTTLQAFKPDRREYVAVDVSVDDDMAEVHYLDHDDRLQTARVEAKRARDAEPHIPSGLVVHLLRLPCPAQKGDIQIVESLTPKS